MVKAVYKNDVKEFKSFVRYTALIFNGKIYSAVAFGSVGILGLVLAIGTVNVIFFGASLIFLAFAGVSIAMNIAAANRAADKMLKNSSDFTKITNEFSFGENDLSVITKTGKHEQTREALYSQLHAVAERKKYFYIYANRKIAYIIKKEGITEGTEEELRAIFFVNFDKKHYKCRKLQKK